MDDKDAIIAALASALRPFALAAVSDRDVMNASDEIELLIACEENSDRGLVIALRYTRWLTVGDLRAAAAALRATGHDIEGGDA